MTNKFYSILLFSFGSQICFAQVDTSEILNSKIFDLLEGFAEDNEELNYYEMIEELIDNPIDINKTDVSELLQIPFLTLNDAKEILKTKNKLKEFKSFDDFSYIKNVHPDLLLLLKLFVKIIPKNKMISSKSIYFRTRILKDLQNRKGFADNKFNGNSLKTYSKLKLKLNNYSSGFVIEKDAGESSIIDHFTGNISYKGNDVLKQIIIGDFSLEFGQGLSIWSPYSISKSSEAVKINKKERFSIPYLSSDENNFLRGISVLTNLNIFEAGAFLSSNKIDASFDSLGNVKSILQTGYHRTSSEIDNYENINFINFGAYLNYNLNSSFSLGFLHYKSSFEKRLLLQSRPFINEKYYSYSAIKYNVYLKIISISGEIANYKNSFAFINNINFDLAKELRLAVSYRNYQKQYYSFFASGFGENSNTNDENGFYFGINSNSQMGKFNFYFDIFNFPNAKNLNGFTSYGNELLFTYEKKILKNLNVNFKFKNETKEALITNDLIEKIGERIKTNYRISLEYNISKRIFGRTRLEMVKFKELFNYEDGFLVYNDLKFNLFNNFIIASRFIFFQTDSYNSRIYEFENDLSGVFSNAVLFGEGLRIYVLVQYNGFENIKLSLKYSETYKPNETKLGSGYSEINGNVDNKLSFQFDFFL